LILIYSEPKVTFFVKKDLNFERLVTRRTKPTIRNFLKDAENMDLEKMSKAFFLGVRGFSQSLSLYPRLWWLSCE